MGPEGWKVGMFLGCLQEVILALLAASFIHYMEVVDFTTGLAGIKAELQNSSGQKSADHSGDMQGMSVGLNCGSWW